MPASSIAQILLRLFALQWVISAIIQLFYMRILEGGGMPHWSIYAPPFIWLAAGLLLWAAAPAVSRLAAKGNDGEFTLKGVSERALYATAFLGLGLYFALGSFAAVFSWIHYYAMHRSNEIIGQINDEPNFYSFGESILTFGAGIALVATCRILARKITPGEKPPPGETAE